MSKGLVSRRKACDEPRFHSRQVGFMVKQTWHNRFRRRRFREHEGNEHGTYSRRRFAPQ